MHMRTLIQLGRMESCRKVDETFVSKFCSSCVWGMGKKERSHCQNPHNRAIGHLIFQGPCFAACSEGSVQVISISIPSQLHYLT